MNENIGQLEVVTPASLGGNQDNIIETSQWPH